MTVMTFEFMDVGMGDSTLVMMGPNANAAKELALIDFGVQPFTQHDVAFQDAMKYLVNIINLNSVQRGLARPFIDHLFLTHGDQDHYNKIPDLINATYKDFPTQKLSIGRLTYGGEASNYWALISNIVPHLVNPNDKPLADEEHSAVNLNGTVTPFRTFVGGAVKVYLLSSNYPRTNYFPNNQKSLCLMFQSDSNKVILMGDAEAKVEEQIIAYYKKATAGFLNAYGLKLGHHGSKNGTSVDWIRAVRPSAIFATGDFVWAHPYCEAITRVINENTLKSMDSHSYCCGTGTGKDYKNNKTQLQIGLNLWYVSDGEYMLQEGTKKRAFSEKSETWGVQWELDFNGNQPPQLSHTDTANPTKKKKAN